MGKPANRPARYVLDEKQLKEICEVAAKCGVDAYLAEHEKAENERQSRVLNSAKALVMNYRRFKKMCEKAVYDPDTVEKLDLREIIELMSGKFRSKDFELVSIKERVVKTKMIMDHVDTMLEVYRQQCYAAPEPEEARRYRVIEGLYLADTPKTVNDIAEEEAVTVSTVYRDCDKAYAKLAVLFFGIDGLRFKKPCEKSAIDMRKRIG